MSIKLGIVMDPIGAIKASKDSSLAMLLAAQKRGWELHYMEQGDLFLDNGSCHDHTQSLVVRDDEEDWFSLSDERTSALTELDVVLLRKDPPVDMEFIYTTFLLQRAEAEGILVVNNPAAVRNANEKLYTTWFTQCCAPSRVTRNAERLKAFLHEHRDIIVKPLDGMGGTSVFRIRENDLNLNVILETMTGNGKITAMAQRYIPEITAGDKRILMINGEPFPHALARIPAQGETRGNLAAGGRGEGVDLSERDFWICQQVGPALREQGLMFVGLDVIGDYLTEINVTSPTCIRELDAIYGVDIAGDFIEAVATRLNQ